MTSFISDSSSKLLDMESDTTVRVFVVTVIGVETMLMAGPESATSTLAAPTAVLLDAVMVKPAELVAPSLTSTVLGSKVIPVAVGVSVIAAPAAAASRLKVTLELATPPSTMEVADESCTVPISPTSSSKGVGRVRGE